MPWYAIYRADNGRLVSWGTVLADPLPIGLSVLEIPAQPRDDQMWDEAMRAFVPRPAKVLIDRLQDIISHADYADFKEVWDALNAARKDKVRSALIRLLGRARWRNVSEPITVQE